MHRPGLTTWTTCSTSRPQSPHLSVYLPPVCGISIRLYSKHSLVPEKFHQSNDSGGRRSWRRTLHFTAFDLQLGFDSASLQLSESLRHRPRAAGSHRLIGPSVAHVQEAGVDVAQSDANLLSRYSTAVADRPGPEAGEDPVQRLSGARSFSFCPFPAHSFWTEPKSIKSEHETLKSAVHYGLHDFK